MNATCPNCGKEFSEHRETAYHCDDCGWLTQLDGKWHPCPEPSRSIEPKPIEPINVPVPPEPVRAEPDKVEDPISQNSDRPPSNVRSYLGGLITVTTEEDSEEALD